MQRRNAGSNSQIAAIESMVIAWGRSLAKTSHSPSHKYQHISAVQWRVSCRLTSVWVPDCYWGPATDEVTRRGKYLQSLICMKRRELDRPLRNAYDKNAEESRITPFTSTHTTHYLPLCMHFLYKHNPYRLWCWTSTLTLLSLKLEVIATGWLCLFVYEVDLRHRETETDKDRAMICTYAHVLAYQWNGIEAKFQGEYTYVRSHILSATALYGVRSAQCQAMVVGSLCPPTASKL